MIRFKPLDDRYGFDDGRHGVYDGARCFFGGGHSQTTQTQQPTANYALPNIIAQVQAAQAGAVPPQASFGSYGWNSANPFATGMQMAAMRAGGQPTGQITPQAGAPQSFFGGGQPQRGMFQSLPQTINYNGPAPQPTPKSKSPGFDWGSLLGTAASIIPFL